MSRARKFNTYAPGSRGPLEVLVDSTWRRLPKVRNVQFQPQTPSETSIEYVDEPTETRSGQSGPGTATVDITRSPGLLSYRTLDAAFRDGETVLRFRDWGGVPQVDPSGAGKTLAITGATGAGVLVGLNAGSASQPAAMFRPGKLVYFGAAVGAQVACIERVTGAQGLELSRYGEIVQAATVTDPGLALPDSEDLEDEAAAVFNVSSFATMREFEGKVTSLGGYSRAPDNSGQVDQVVVNVLEIPSDQTALIPATG